MNITHDAYKSTYRGWSDFTSTVSQAVLAGEDSFDLVVGAAYMLPSLAVDGLFVDWYDIPNVDFTNPWWSTDAIGELSIANHSYFAIGDFCLSNIGIMMCISTTAHSARTTGSTIYIR